MKPGNIPREHKPGVVPCSVTIVWRAPVENEGDRGGAKGGGGGGGEAGGYPRIVRTHAVTVSVQARLISTRRLK